MSHDAPQPFPESPGPESRDSERPPGAKSPGELEWQAHLYVSGDLDGESLEAFETLLSDSQAAREAVARMVALATAGRSLEHSGSAIPVIPAKPAHRMRALAPWLAGTLALSLGVILAGRWITETEPERPVVTSEENVPDGSEDSSEITALAQAWLSSAFDHEADPGSGISPSPTAEAGAEWMVDVLPSDDALSTPDWMIAAVAQSQAVSSEAPETGSPEPPVTRSSEEG